MKIFSNTFFVLIIISLCSFPFYINEYYLHNAIIIICFAVLALSWDLAARAGILSLAHAAFFGLGGYTSALLMKYFSLPVPLCFTAAGIFGSLVAVLLGFVTLRLSGLHFAIGTMAFTMLLQVLALHFKDFTGGAMGISIPMLFDGSRIPSYFLLIAVLTVLLICSTLLQRSSFYLAYTSIRTNESTAAVLGVNTNFIKISLFSLSSFFASITGAIYFSYTSSIIPYEAFSLDITVSSIVMAVFGGLFSTIGPIIGAFFLKMIEEYLRGQFTSGHMILYGLILIFAVLVMPQGILGVIKKWKKLFKS